jgi:hypothetical protein
MRILTLADGFRFCEAESFLFAEDDMEGEKRAPAHPERIYGGWRPQSGGAGTVGWQDPNGGRGMLDARLDLRGHSPDGFQWGYGGSGPAQLALALVADATGDDELAQKVYQRFKDEIVAGMERDSWTLGAGEIQDFARSLYAEELAHG